MADAAKAKPLSFDMKDRPGLLSEVSAAPAEADVSIPAVSAHARNVTA